MEYLRGKRVLVVGMGKSGAAAKGALLEMGAFVSVRDDNQGLFPEPDAVFDMLVVSPGVPLDLDYIREASEAGSEIIGELELRGYFVVRGKVVFFVCPAEAP